MINHNILENLSFNKGLVTEGNYVYNGVFVPRVTEILSSMLHEDYLLDWSNYLGFQRKRYRDELEWYANVGTIVHDIVEEIILKGYSDICPQNHTMVRPIYNAVDSFIQWYEVILRNQSKIIATEKKLVCKWFGGTCDLLININGKLYLMDFKTSKKVSFKHILQLSAYKYMCELEGLKIDGIGVLLLSRDRVEFSENILHIDNPEHRGFIDYCTNTFFSLVHSYYHRLNTELIFNMTI